MGQSLGSQQSSREKALIRTRRSQFRKSFAAEPDFRCTETKLYRDRGGKLLIGYACSAEQSEYLIGA